jgi:hypothetical protein
MRDIYLKLLAHFLNRVFMLYNKNLKQKFGLYCCSADNEYIASVAKLYNFYAAQGRNLYASPDPGVRLCMVVSAPAAPALAPTLLSFYIARQIFFFK